MVSGERSGETGGFLMFAARHVPSRSFPFTYRILLSHEIDGVRKEKERLTASMFAGYSPRSCGSCFAHSLGSYPSHEVK